MTKAEAMDAEMRLVNAGRHMQNILQNQDVVYLLERIDKRADQVRKEIIESPDWNTHVELRGELKGLSALRTEIDTIISKGKAAERRLKI